MVDSQRQDRLGGTSRMTQVDGLRVSAISGVVCGDCRFILEVEIVVFKPICNRLASMGNSSSRRKGSLPPPMVFIKVSHK